MKKTPVEKKAISDLIYEKLYSQIVNGKLSPGQRITELQVAQSHGVSQAPVREAFKRLAEDRLITLVPRSGCYVCKITREDAEYLFEIRKRLEILALEYAYGRFDVDILKKLRDEMAACGKLHDGEFVKRAIVLDAKLHSIIAEFSGSMDLQILIDKLRARIQLLRVRGAANIAAAENSLEAHLKIVDAVINGNKKLAVDLLAEHIDYTRDNVFNNYIWE